MSLFDKLRTDHGAPLPRQGMASPRVHVASAVAAAPVNVTKTGSSAASHVKRLSNGLKEFLCQLDGIGRGHLLDLGSARQTTITFFIDRGFKVYTEDLLITWKNFLDAELVSRLVARITSLVRDGGVAFAIFHNRKPESFHRYRVVDAQNLELIPAPCAFAPQRVFQNREISDLFRRFRSSRTFVGRDQLREGLFVK